MKKSVVKISIIVGVIIALIILYLFTSSILQEQFSSNTDNSEILYFCSTVDECIYVLTSQGMPNNYLEQEGITITCDNGKCTAKK
jgi:hypothetical protein